MTNLEIILLSVASVQAAVLVYLGFNAAVDAKVRRILEAADDDSEPDDPTQSSMEEGIASGTLFGVSGPVQCAFSPPTKRTIDRLVHLREQLYRGAMETEIANLEKTLEVPFDERWRA